MGGRTFKTTCLEVKGDTSQKIPHRKVGDFSYPFHFIFYPPGNVPYPADGIPHCVAATFDRNPRCPQVKKLPLQTGKIAGCPEMLQLWRCIVLDLHLRPLLLPAHGNQHPQRTQRQIQHHIIAAAAFAL